MFGVNCDPFVAPAERRPATHLSRSPSARLVHGFQIKRRERRLHVLGESGLLPHPPTPPCLVCLTLWAAAVCLTVAGYEDVGQASGSGDFCKGGYGTAVAAAAASAQSKPASSVTGPGVGECRHKPNSNQKGGKGKKNKKQKAKPTLSLPSSPYVTNHSSPPLAPCSFASLLIIAAPVGR